MLAQPAVELVVHGPVGEEEHAADGEFHRQLIISTLTIRRATPATRATSVARCPGPSPRTFSTCTSASRSWSIQSPSWSPTSRTHQASAWLRLRATPASTRVSSTWRSGRRRRVITGTLRLVNSSSSSPQRAPHATLRAKRASASSAMRMRSARVSSRKPWMRARQRGGARCRRRRRRCRARAACRSPRSRRGRGSTSGGPVNQPSGRRPANQPWSLAVPGTAGWRWGCPSAW